MYVRTAVIEHQYSFGIFTPLISILWQDQEKENSILAGKFIFGGKFHIYGGQNHFPAINESNLQFPIL